MPLLNNGTIIAIDEETVIGQGQSGVWVDTDVVPFQDDSGLTPATDSLERNNFNGSFISCQALSGNESTSGSLNLEVGLTPVAGTEAGMFKGHLLYKATLGTYLEQAADVVGDTIVEEADPASNPTGYDLYRLSTPSEPRTTLAVREFLGGDGNAVIDHKGVVGDSVAFDFSAGQITTASFSVSGTAFTPASGQTVLAMPTCGEQPFVTKSAVFKVDGVSIDAQNVSMTVSNTVVDRQAISSTGISDKVVVAKSVSLDYTLDLEDVTAYTKLKNNTTAEIFIELVNPAGDEVKFYLPVVSYTEVSKNNDGGVLTLNISSMGYNDAEGNALYIAAKKA